MSFTTACAVLCGEPFLYRPWEVAKLTPYQVNAILFHERDDKGQIAIPGAGEIVTYEDRFRRAWAARGLWQADIDRKWREYQRGDGSR